MQAKSSLMDQFLVLGKYKELSQYGNLLIWMFNR